MVCSVTFWVLEIHNVVSKLPFQIGLTVQARNEVTPQRQTNGQQGTLNCIILADTCLECTVDKGIIFNLLFTELQYAPCTKEEGLQPGFLP